MCEGFLSGDTLRDAVSRMRKVVVVDIETTGFSREKHAEIIEIGAVKIDLHTRKVIGVFNQLICPSDAFSISPKITSITTIDWAQVKDQPYIEKVLPAFYEFIEDCPIVAHNASFDWNRFLLPCFESIGLHASNPVIDTMALAKELFPGRGRSGYNLEALCEMYGSRVEGHHRAYIDCKYTGSLFLRMLDELKSRSGIGAGQSTLLAPPVRARTTDFRNLRIRRVSVYKSTPRLGPKIYVYTNLGVIYYTPRRKVWTVQELRTDENAPAQEWGRAILRQLNSDEQSFVNRYAQIA